MWPSFKQKRIVSQKNGNSKHILVAGMGRSGSTALFNIIRLCLKESKKKIYSCWFENYSENNTSEYHIVKIHDFDERFSSWADMVFTPRRDLRDAISSLKIYRPQAIKTDDDLIEWGRRLTGWHLKWCSRSSYEFVYEKYYSDPLHTIAEISNVLGVNSVESEKVYEDINILSTKKPKWKPLKSDNLLFKNHIGPCKGKIGSYKQNLKHNEIILIEKEFHDWLRTYSYIS